MAKEKIYPGMKTEKSEKIFTRKVKIPLVPLIIIFVFVLVIALFINNSIGKGDTRVLIEYSTHSATDDDSWLTGVLILENGYIYSMKSNYFVDSNQTLEEISQDLINKATFKVGKVSEENLEMLKSLLSNIKDDYDYSTNISANTDVLTQILYYDYDENEQILLKTTGRDNKINSHEDIDTIINLINKSVD